MNLRRDDERLADIIDAIDAIRSHLTRGDLSDGLIFDAVRVRLIEIGEAVKLLDPKLVASEPDVAWSDAAGMRDWLAHHYFDTSRAVVEATITEDLPPLEVAVLIWTVLDGELSVAIADQCEDLRSGDTIVIPADLERQIYARTDVRLLVCGHGNAIARVPGEPEPRGVPAWIA